MLSRGRKREASLKPNSRPKRFGYFQILKSQKTWSRFVFIMSLVIVMVFSSKDKEKSLAKQKEELERRGQTFDCHPDYKEEISSYSGCSTERCGRHVFDKLVTNEEVDTLLTLAEKGFELGGSDGGASILDLHSGALSLGKQFINIYSLEEAKNVFTEPDLAVYKIVKAKIQHAIAETFHIERDSLYLTHPTFFSRLTNLDPQTEHDEYWHPHVDKVTYESFHYTSLLYLSDYDIDFKSGRLVFMDGNVDKQTNITVEPRKGRVTLFTSGAENVHFVERVTEGTRYAITVSFTCDASKSISDPDIKILS